MGYHLARLATYVNWPTDITSVSCLTLASSGFVYTGESDQVTCPLCGLVVKDWRQTSAVSPLDEHRRRSPQCPFFSEESPPSDLDVQRQPTETVPTSGLSGLHRGTSSSSEPAASDIVAVHRSALKRERRRGAVDDGVGGNSATSRDPETGARPRVDRASPDYGLLRRESARLSTFDDWPASDVVRPSDLARAGFFYTGESDRTRCAFCRGVLHSWRPADDADAEHRRHFPDCRLVRRLDVGNVRDASPLDRQMSALGVNDVASASRRHPENCAVVSAAGATSARSTDVLPAESSANTRQGGEEHQTATGNSAEQQTTESTTKLTNALGRCAAVIISGSIVLLKYYQSVILNIIDSTRQCITVLRKVGWLVCWGLTALSTQFRSYRAFKVKTLL